LFIGQHFDEHQKLASTNAYAQLLLSKSKPSEGTVISARNQTIGRGQIGSLWESEPDKNLNLSVILYPTFLPIQQQFQLNQAISLGVRDFVAKYVQKLVKIKWSNDIYVNDNKICGILIQNTLKGVQIQSSIVGLGININQTDFLSNPPNPTSFKLETQRDFDLSEMKRTLCECLEPRYFQLKNRRHDELYLEYLSQLYRYQERALFQRPNGEAFMGMITGISDIGKLEIETSGKMEEFAIKEVKFL
jgi:BirA family biotin operon repressor/biotin-[acetyl-CoA-carboxylase] ligase